MNIITSGTEVKLVDRVKALKGDFGTNYALVFNFSQLQEQFKSEFQLKIALNILYDVFRSSEGNIYLCQDGDIIVIYQGSDRNLMEKAIFQLRYLYVEDPLANLPDGTENPAFCSIYDLAFQWQPFHNICSDKMAASLRKATVAAANKGKADSKFSRQPLTATNLQKVQELLDTIEVAHAIRFQPICAQPQGKQMRILFEEVYIHIAHLSRLMGDSYDLFSDKTLFKYITRQLDKHVLRLLASDPGRYMKRPLSININVESILSPYFSDFCERINNLKPTSVVFEIQVADVFNDMRNFLSARDLVQKYGGRVCLDGLNTLNFPQIDRQSLGFDLAKVQWNADVAGNISNDENKRIKEAVDRCGSNRIILCWCDSVHAVEYGHALGVSLFQGRYPDRIVNPDSKIEN